MMINDNNQLFNIAKQLKMAESQVEYDSLKAEEKAIGAHYSALKNKKLKLETQNIDCERKYLKMEWQAKNGVGKFMGKRRTFLQRVFRKSARKEFREYKIELAKFQTLSNEYETLQREIEATEIELADETAKTNLGQKISAAKDNLIKIQGAKNLEQLGMTREEAIQYVQRKAVDDKAFE